MLVRAFKGGEIAKGLYKNIKPVVVQNGGHYEKSIYLIDGTGELMNIALKGSAVAAWSSFIEENGNERSINEWIAISGAQEAQKGAVKYTTPMFEYLKPLTADEVGEADTKYRELMTYFNKYLTQTPKKEEEIDD